MATFRIPTIPGQPLNPFLPPGGAAYVDIRGIASSREFVYIADQATLYCFDKRGNLRNAVGAPDTIQGVTIFPPTVAEEVDAPGGYLLANAPVIVHDPVQTYGYITVYAPGLDPSVTREDANHPDASRLFALPWGGEVLCRRISMRPGCACGPTTSRPTATARCCA